MTRVLITGASGFIGRHCVAIGAAAGFEVHAAVGARRVEFPPEVVVHRVELLDLAAARRLIAEARPTLLLHLAWDTTPGRFWNLPANLDWTAASLALVRAFRARGGVRAVVAGSCAEYDDSPSDLHETETPCRPATLYGTCKHALHEVLAAFADESDMELAWARLFGIFGPHEHPRRLVASTIRSLLAGEPVLCTDGEQERDFLHVRDVADALVALLHSPLTGPVNVGSGEATSVADLIELIASRAGCGSQIRYGALRRPLHDPARVVADVGRLRDELEWAPSLTLEEGLAHTICWWKSTEGRHADAA